MTISLRVVLAIGLPIFLLGVLISHWLTTAPATALHRAASGLPVMVSPLPETEGWTLTAVGDIMLDRHVRTIIERNGAAFPFEKIRPVLTGDLVVGNLEGPLTNSRSVATDTHLIFTFDPALAPVLRQTGFTHLSLANNHTLNFGQAGLNNTRRVLADNGIVHFGDPRNATGFGRETRVGQKSIALIGFHGLVSGIETITDDIRQAKEHEMFVIVMPHWGSEYQLGTTTRQRTQAHGLIEAGADLIIGAHPHVVEPLEIYQNKLIFYSLGNFLFDQYFSEDTQQGLILQFNVGPQSLEAELLPIRTTAQQIQRLEGAARQTLLDRLARDSHIDEPLREEIRSGRLTLPR